ncbi:AAA family ATPase [Thermosipho atlanticus]|uniref:AAA family ATPase n=1 Tax=Thermosipho atlanticus TaxID=238991 RepID=UPI00228647F4|nr:AAA family ATPase [Thermosipho atlanticus]
MENFRKFKFLVLEDLSNINIFFGDNNSGKTTILEALFLHSSGLNIGAFINVVFPARQKNIFTSNYEFGEDLLNLFYNGFDSSGDLKINIISIDENDSENKTEIKFFPSTFLSQLMVDNVSTNYEVTDFVNESNKMKENVEQGSLVFLGKMEVTMNNEKKLYELTLPLKIESSKYLKLAVYHDILSHRNPSIEKILYGDLKRKDKLNETVQELQKVFPEITGIDNIPYPDGSPKIYVQTKNSKLPFSLFGDGFRRFFYLIGNMEMYRNSVHLIEEIDATFHPSSVPTLARLLINYSLNYYEQMFLTSHNQEFLEIFLNAFEDRKEILENNIRVFTLKELNGKQKLLKLNGFDALKYIKKFNMELR